MYRSPLLYIYVQYVHAIVVIQYILCVCTQQYNILLIVICIYYLC